MLSVKPYEIDMKDVQFGKSIGFGSFGEVRLSYWKTFPVAVKIIFDKEKESFLTEAKHLARLKHSNIIELYGVNIKKPYCLIMEYAELGALNEVLYASHYDYTFVDAISWCCQCASAVAYLHSQKPSPTIHRDLKPQNILMFDGGLKVKICDFGIACSPRDDMTSDRGTIAWMAPEVISSSKYNEKCDVYSWSIILWQVMSREIPYRGNNNYQITFKVPQGLRPNRLKSCPPIIENILTKCWHADPAVRPVMSQIVTIMETILRICKEDGKHPKPLSKQEGVFINQDQESTYYGTDDYEEAINLNKDNLESNAPWPDDKNIITAYQSYRYNDLHRFNLNDNRNTSSSRPSSSIPSHLVNGLASVEHSSDRLSASIFTRFEPIEPDHRDRESVEVYQRHLALHQQYKKKLMEIQVLRERRDLLRNCKNNINETLQSRKEELITEKMQLVKFKQNLQLQLNALKEKLYQ